MILGILLGILKWIGIILLAIVGLILLIVLLVLLCPFTYNINVEANAKDLKATRVKVKLGWLFWIIRPVVSYEDEKLGIIVRIFGIPINLTKEKKKKKKRKKTAAKKPSSEDKNNNKELSEPEAIIEDNNDDTEDNQLVSINADELETELIDMDSFDKNDSINESMAASPKKASVLDKIKALFKREKKPKLSPEEKKKLKEARKKELEDKIKKLKDSFARIKEIYKTLTDKETKEAIRLVLNVLKKSLKHLLPRRIRGKLKYGFENPETTGQVLSIMAMAYPIHKGRVGLLPVFETEEMVLDGKINLRGHVMLGFFLLQLLRLWNNKFIRNMIKSAMSK